MAAIASYVASTLPESDASGPTVAAGQLVTLSVPADFSSISSAWDSIAEWSIASTGRVVIQVADGTYNISTTLVLNHPFGSRISILGNVANKSACVLLFSPNMDAIYGSLGNAMPFIDGFTIKKSTKAVWPDNTTGILADMGATMNVGANVLVDNFYYGAAWRQGSNGKFFGVVDHAGDVGIWSAYGSSGNAQGATSMNAVGTDGGGASLGFGFQAEYGSFLHCQGATASGNAIAGIAALSGSEVQALSATTINNTGSGFYALDGGTIACHNAVSTGNARWAIEEVGASRVIGNNMTTNANTLGSRKPAAYFDNTDSVGARLAGNGAFRIDTNGADPIYFNTAGGLQFQVAHTAAAVNRWSITGSATGQALGLSAVGTDVNIDLSFTPKGTGLMKFGTVTASADAAVTGYISVRDAGGTIRKLAIIA